jgi:hypothetical protein
MGYDWDSVLIDYSKRSWEEILKPGERTGGPSPWGNSKWQDLKWCPYRYCWKHVKRMRQLHYNSNLEIGGLTHEAIGNYYQTYLNCIDAKQQLMKDEIDDRCRMAAFDILNRAEEIVPATAGVSRKLIEAWLALYGPGTVSDDRHETYDVECLLEVSDPLPYSTRLDRWVWSDRLDGPMIWEVKTAGRRDGKLISSYRADPQFLGHQWLWRKTLQRKYGKLKGYQVLLITKTEPVAVYDEIIPINEALIRDFEKEMRWVNQVRIHCEMEKRWPRIRTYRCRFCEIFDVCASNGRNTQGWAKKRRNEY